MILTAQTTEKAQRTNIRKALRIAGKQAPLLNETRQLLVVFNSKAEAETAVMVALEKKNRRWCAAMPAFEAGIGRNGFAAPGAKREGDQKSPGGFFRLGKLFCYHEGVDTRMPYIRSTADDKWIDDPESPDYNRHIRGATAAKSWENLLLKSNDYRYCMVIEYNTQPVVKGMGSAIFLHIGETDGINSSSGCVVVSRLHMEKLLKWMNPESKPAILMGNENDLETGFLQR